MFQKRTIIIVFVIVALGLGFGTFFLRSNRTKPEKKVEASSANATITTQANWDSGTKDNIDSSSTPGEIKISDKASSKIDLSSIYSADNSVVTSQMIWAVETGAKSGPIDGNLSTAWGFTCPAPESTSNDDGNPFGSGWWQIDLKSIHSLKRMRMYVEATWPFYYNFTLSGSSNGTDFSTIMDTTSEYADKQWYQYDINATARYVRLYIGAGAWSDMRNLDEFELYSNAIATHTTGATQIDGGANFWQWETFTDSKTTPANTSVTYRYRTSANGTDWTSWVGSISSVTSRQGDDSNNPTKYRYLQIEATLSNTDGASTPTIDSYTIGYHTNQKPNAPTAMTAVVN